LQHFGDILQAVQSKTVWNNIYLGAMQGAVAWSAYALIEFFSSSVLFRLMRPYATFTAWHWQLTAMLVAAYLLAGVLLGGLAGIVLSVPGFGRAGSAVMLEGSATLTLLLAFALNILSFPRWPQGKLFLLVLCVALGAVVVIGMRSEKWSERLGLLTNPWVVASVLLGLGQGVGFLQLWDLGRELGARNWLWMGLLALAMTAVVAGAVVVGRWLRPRLIRDRFTLFAPSWAALGLALILMVGSFGWREGPSRRHPRRPRRATRNNRMY
jgi:hypothetical protein